MEVWEHLILGFEGGVFLLREFSASPSSISYWHYLPPEGHMSAPWGQRFASVLFTVAVSESRAIPDTEWQLSIYLLKEWLLQQSSSTLSCIWCRKWVRAIPSHIFQLQWAWRCSNSMVAYGEIVFLVWRNVGLFKFKPRLNTVKSLRIIFLRRWLECDSFCPWRKWMFILRRKRKERERRRRGEERESERWKGEETDKRGEYVTQWTNAI